MTGNQVLFLNRAEVEQCLTMPACTDAVADAMAAASAGIATTPLRLVDPLADKSGFIAVMPASASDPAVYGVKTLSLHPDNPAQGIPAIQGFVALFDHASGRPIAFVDGASVTAIRTAAASAVATRALARDDAKTHGIFGTGVQAVSHAEAILVARPALEKIRIWGRDPDKAIAAAELISSRTGMDTVVETDPSRAADCDIISAVTGATEPILHHDWLAPGTHVNLVGSHTPDKREADSATIANARVYVDLMSSALSEAGDILQPIEEGVFSADDIIGEIGRLLLGKVDGRTSATDITLFKSLGFAAEDIFAGWAAYEAAITNGFGVSIDWS